MTSSGLLRFAVGLVRDDAVDAWFAARPADLSAIARQWFEAMRSCGPDVRELVHDGCPVACVDAAPFGYVNIFSSHLSVGFFQGAALDDPRRVLEGTGKRMRHVKIRPATAVDAEALLALIRAAYDDIQVRVRQVPRP